MPMLSRAALAAALLLGAALPADADETVTTEAVLGALTVTPATGTTDTPDVTFSSPACPAGANAFKIGATGGTFAEGSNALSANEIPSPGNAISGYPMGATWADRVTSQGGSLPLSGAVTLTLLCIQDGATPVGEFVATLVFTPTGGQQSAYTVFTPPTPIPLPTPPTPMPPPPECVWPLPFDCNGLPAPSPSPTATGTRTFRLTIAGDPGPAGLVLTAPAAPDTVLTFYGYRWNGALRRLYGASIWPVTVADMRPGRPAWTLAAQLSPFRTASGQGIGQSIQLRPKLHVPGAGAVAGSGANMVLASAVAGHGGDTSTSATVGGDLFAFVTGAPGDYTATMTLTLMG